MKAERRTLVQTTGSGRASLVCSVLVCAVFVCAVFLGAFASPAPVAAQSAGAATTLAPTSTTTPPLGPVLGPAPTLQPNEWSPVVLAMLLTVTPLLTVAALFWISRKPLAQE